MSSKPLSLLEREEIAVALIENSGVSWAEIGRRVERHPSTIAREVTRHGGRGKSAGDRSACNRREPATETAGRSRCAWCAS